MEIWSRPKASSARRWPTTPRPQPPTADRKLRSRREATSNVGTINAENQVARVQTLDRYPVLGDTPVETTFAEYRDFGGVMFPGHIVRTQGGHPVLDLTVSTVKANPAVDVTVPERRQNRHDAPRRRHSGQARRRRLLPQRREPPQRRDRAGRSRRRRGGSADRGALAGGDCQGEGNNPEQASQYLINTHVHFDHSGGLRTWVDEGSTIVTHQMNKPYYEQAWAAPHTLNPDKLAQSKKGGDVRDIRRQTRPDRRQASDRDPRDCGQRPQRRVAMIYLPKEKILIEGDAYTPAAADAPPPASPNPFSVNLYENIQPAQARCEADRGAARTAPYHDRRPSHGDRRLGRVQLNSSLGALGSY